MHPDGLKVCTTMMACDKSALEAMPSLQGHSIFFPDDMPQMVTFTDAQLVPLSLTNFAGFAHLAKFCTTSIGAMFRTFRR